MLPKSRLSSAQDTTHIVCSFWDHWFYSQYWYETNTTI